MIERSYFAYIMASKSRTLYAGVTNDVRKRSFDHKQKTHNGFTAKYNCNRLVWFQEFANVGEAIQREKELKGWIRAKKIALVESTNPTWQDLSAPWFPISEVKDLLLYPGGSSLFFTPANIGILFNISKKVD